MSRNPEPLRVALVTGSLARSGAEKQFVYMAQALQQSGVEVRVYSFSKGEYYENVLREAGLEPIWVGESSNRLVRIYTLTQALRSFRPHIIQTGQLFTAFYAGITGRLIGSISIGNMRSRPTATIKKWGKVVFYTVLRLTNFVIVNSNNAYHEIASTRIINPERLYVLNNVIELEPLDPGQQDSRTPVSAAVRPTFIFVGRLIRLKRIERFLNALALSRQHIPDIQGLIVGTGSEEDNLKKTAEELGLLPDHVQFLGMRSDVPQLLNKSDILVLCSDHEGFPNVIIEAMAAGLPVITTPAGDSGVVVEDGITGYVVPFDDTQCMADRMTTLISSPELRRRMGEAGRIRVENHYSYSSLMRSLIAIYHDIGTKTRSQSVLNALEALDNRLKEMDGQV